MTDFFNSMWLFTVAYNWLPLLLLLSSPLLLMLFGVVFFFSSRFVHSIYASLIRLDKLSISVRSAMTWFLSKSWSMLFTPRCISLSLLRPAIGTDTHTVVVVVVLVCYHRQTSEWDLAVHFTAGGSMSTHRLFCLWFNLIVLFISLRLQIDFSVLFCDAFVLVFDCMCVTEILCIKI